MVDNGLNLIKDPVPQSDVVPDAEASLDQQVPRPNTVVDVCSDTGFSSDDTDKSPPLVKTFGAGVAQRLRSSSGKAIASVPQPPVVESVKKPAKKPMYGPSRPKSRFDTPVVQKKQLKRKAVESDSDLEEEVSKGEASGEAYVGRQSVGGKKVLANVPEVAIDNIFFHLASCVDKWKYVQRRVALERELGKEALECTDIVSLIEEAGAGNNDVDADGEPMIESSDESSSE